MNAFELLSLLCTDCIDLEHGYVLDGHELIDNGFLDLLPINRDSVLDDWFKKELDYFCLYAKKNSDYTFLKEPDLRVANKYFDDEEIHFWIIEK